jgi:hypothetical protein
VTTVRWGLRACYSVDNACGSADGVLRSVVASDGGCVLRLAFVSRCGSGSARASDAAQMGRGPAGGYCGARRRPRQVVLCCEMYTSTLWCLLSNEVSLVGM